MLIVPLLPQSENNFNASETPEQKFVTLFEKSDEKFLLWQKW